MVLKIRNEITIHHVFWGWVGGGVNYQTHIATKLLS